MCVPDIYAPNKTAKKKTNNPDRVEKHLIPWQIARILAHFITHWLIWKFFSYIEFDKANYTMVTQWDRNSVDKYMTQNIKQDSNQLQTYKLHKIKVFLSKRWNLENYSSDENWKIK